MLHPVHRRRVAGIAWLAAVFGDSGAFSDEPVRERSRNFVDGVLLGVFSAQENGAREPDAPRSPSLFPVRCRPCVDCLSRPRCLFVCFPLSFLFCAFHVQPPLSFFLPGSE
jgi:hypothetical protein